MFPPDPRVSALRQEGLHSLNYYHARGNCWQPRYLQRTALPLSARLCQPPAALAVTRDFSTACMAGSCATKRDVQLWVCLPKTTSVHLRSPFPLAGSPLTSHRHKTPSLPAPHCFPAPGPAAASQLCRCKPPSLTQHYLFGWRRGEPRIPTASRPRARPACSVHPGFRQS